MPNLEPYDELLVQIQDEWNIAESDIKQAEQICNGVVIPSIIELRYAGRRIIEALTKIQLGAPEIEISDLLSDARFNCHRARLRLNVIQMGDDVQA